MNLIIAGVCTIHIHPLMLANNLMIVDASESGFNLNFETRFVCYVRSQDEVNRLEKDPSPILEFINRATDDIKNTRDLRRVTSGQESDDSGAATYNLTGICTPQNNQV